MGTAIDRINFSDSDYRRFSARLRDNLSAFRRLAATPGFGDGELSFGAELELYIIDTLGRPLHINQEIKSELQDSQLTLELNRYNLEYNFSPVLVKNDCFRTTQTEALAALQKIDQCAQKWHGSTAAIGILPTLRQSDIGYHAMTKTPRYEALTRQLSKIRGGPFYIDIEGEEPIHLEMEDVTLEGANTSFQVHLKVPVREFANTYNALQLVTPLVLALAANSPTLFGHRLWQETRVPLFKQSIDCRRPDPLHPQPARVNYGHSWLRLGAVELFAESIYLYRPVLPLLSDEDPLEVLKAGGIPQLNELRIQQGSVWLWNRPVYDPADGGHLRIEMRALPAGPSIVDMLANAALMIGLTKVMQKKINRLLPAIPFDYCIRNFYRAAEKGLQAELIWPSATQNEPEYHRVSDILRDLLPRVPEQLAAAGFNEGDYVPLLDIIEERLDNGQTGSQWQLSKLSELETDLSRQKALAEMLQQYQQLSRQNIPVARWS
ncbi:MAG: glutamate--cysteine ligase [Cellvibrionaceae bacterium]